MKNYLAALLFIAIAFVTGLSIAFNVCSMVGQEENFFKTTKNALIVYGVSIAIAILFTAMNLNLERNVSLLLRK